MRATQGVARAIAVHSFETALTAGFRAMPFDFVIASAVVAVGLWQAMGSAILGRVPAAFDDPQVGLVDGLIVHRCLQRPIRWRPN